MILTKPQAQSISRKYNLGKVISFKLFSGGLVNYNYKLTTDKGIFVIRILGDKMDDWKKKKFELEQEVLEHLRKKKFPYQIPIALKDSEGKILGKVGNLNYWVYLFLEGEELKRLDDKQFLEISKALSTYQEFIKDFKIKSLKGEFSLDWILHKYKIMERKLKNLKRLSKTDKLVSKNFQLFNRLINELSKIDFLINPVVCHGDLISSNVLFKDNKLVAIIDFDNLKIAPSVEEIAYTLRVNGMYNGELVKKRYNILLKEFEKKIKLSKKEKDMIIPLMLRSNAIVFWWMYDSMKKGQDKKYEMIRWTIDNTVKLERKWKR